MSWDKFFRCYVGDCVELMRKMPEKAFHTCVTSPPYYGLRDYGVDGQIGLEPTPEEFIEKLVGVFREVRRVLRDDGTLWVNIGDTYATGGRGGGGSFMDARSDGAWKGKNAVTGWRSAPQGMKHKDLIGIPWMLAFALRADGWYLRQDIIWHKPNPMPESVRDRCTKAHEYVFLLSKRPKDYFDHEAIKEPVTGNSHPRGKGVTPKSQANAFGNRNNASFSAAVSGLVELRNRRTVWSVPTRPFKGAHFATFPPALVEPCILAGCPRGGAVIDPFGGSGTSAGVAVAHGRKAVLCELNPAYAAMVPGRVHDVATSITKN
ncbi:site-specific DNA-methyltransferase [Serratia fonticola]|uniref:site-specific DNA-methyltransferase n=1 Tax=Serratia fonticola TaxID=47917 RepID=UPI0034C65A98